MGAVVSWLFSFIRDDFWSYHAEFFVCLYSWVLPFPKRIARKKLRCAFVIKSRLEQQLANHPPGNTSNNNSRRLDLLRQVINELVDADEREVVEVVK